MSQDFFDGYDGQTTDELLALETTYRTDSLVLAFEAALRLEPDPAKLSREETWILAIEALEREVNNGGYDQFFLNSSGKLISIIVRSPARHRLPTDRRHHPRSHRDSPALRRARRGRSRCRTRRVRPALLRQRRAHRGPALRVDQTEPQRDSHRPTTLKQQHSTHRTDGACLALRAPPVQNHY